MEKHFPGKRYNLLIILIGDGNESQATLCCSRPVRVLIFIQGISLSIEQFNALVELLPQIEDSLKSKGEPVSRPSYGGTTTTTTEPPSDSNDKSAEDNNEVDQAGENGPVEPQQNSNKLEKFKYTRKNHEATSDEEE